MKKWTRYMLLLMPVLMVQALSSCSLIDEPEYAEGDGSVTASLAFSLSASAKYQTRMDADVVQNNNYYRVISDWHVIPFEVRDRKIKGDDLAKRERLDGGLTKFDKTSSWFFYTEHCEFMRGVASFLVYARALPTYGNSDEPTIAQKSANGSLTAVFPADMNPIGITFSPEAIYGTNTAHEKANALASYLTAIANTSVVISDKTYKWSSPTAPAMKALYQNFIGQENVTAMDIAASSTNVIKYVNELYQQVKGMRATASGTDLNICNEILSNISSYTGVVFSESEGKVTSLGDAMSGFPANLGLPDGAAVVRWTGSSFTPQTQTTTMDNITGITRYAYPAELYYYTNSLIKTSTEEGKQPYYTSEDTWAKVLSKYEYENGVVTPNTKAVAIIDPLQYGVAHLQVMLKKVATTTVEDAAGEDITIGTDKFKLTAIIVGNQHPVGFDFKPCSSDAYFLYDPNVTSDVFLSSSAYQNNSEVSAVTHTLVLHSNDDEEIPLVLEFTNNSDQTIVGVDNGQIYPGTKFYLVAEVKPETVVASADDYKKRVFTQDHTTTMTMKVESLAKAYNVVPNLLSPRLEVGVQVVTNWMQVDPTNVMLE